MSEWSNSAQGTYGHSLLEEPLPPFRVDDIDQTVGRPCTLVLELGEELSSLLSTNTMEFADREPDNITQ